MNPWFYALRLVGLFNDILEPVLGDWCPGEAWLARRAIYAATGLWVDVTIERE